MRLLLLLLLVVAGACASPRQREPASQRSVLLPGVRLEAPAGRDWIAVQRGAERIVLQRAAPEATATIVAEVIPMDASGDDASFVRSAEAYRESAMRTLEMVSVHYNSTSLNGAACLAYDGIYRDAAADPTRQFRMLDGLVCRVAAGAIQLEMLIESASRTPPEAEHLLGVADTFFGSAVFSPQAAR